MFLAARWQRCQFLAFIWPRWTKMSILGIHLAAMDQDLHFSDIFAGENVNMMFKKRWPVKITSAVQNKKSGESSSGMFQFYLKRVSKEGVCQMWLYLLTYPIADDHNSWVFAIRFDKHPILMTCLDRIKTVHYRIHPTFFSGQNPGHLFLASCFQK